MAGKKLPLQGLNCFIWLCQIPAPNAGTVLPNLTIFCKSFHLLMWDDVGLHNFMNAILTEATK
jgi:hypothetical protein